MEYVRVNVSYQQGYYDNPTFTASGKIPVDTTAAFEIYPLGFTFEKVMETVQSGDNTLTFTITARESDGTKEQTATVTITGVNGEGYDFNLD